jgi:four helix bundle protein
MGDKIRNFTDLIAWQEGHKLVIQIYKITRKFPKTETFALMDQIIRAVVSVTSNIAEGFGRQGLKEKIQFYFMAQGSLTEVQNQLLIAKDISYINDKEFTVIWDQTITVQKLVSGLIKSIRRL